MGTDCCLDRGKPQEMEKPKAPQEGFITKKPKEASITKKILMISSTETTLKSISAWLLKDQQVIKKGDLSILVSETCDLEISQVPTSDASRLAALARIAEAVFFFVDLQDSRALDMIHTSATTFLTQSRKNSEKYIVGYNNPSNSTMVSSEAIEVAADLHFTYTEIFYPKDSPNGLLQKMIEAKAE